jgi:gluconolactonase
MTPPKSLRLPALAIAALVSLILPHSTPASGDAPPSPIRRLDPALDRLLAPGTPLEVVATGFRWTEGPVWTRAGYLLFEEIPSNSMLRLHPDSTTTVFMRPTGYQGSTPYGGPEPGSNGITLDRTGRLTVAGHAARNIWRLESPGNSLDPHAVKTILADSYQGQPLNSPNDLVYRSDGSIYFTDPPYGLRTQGDSDPEKRLSFNGVYRIPAAATRAPGSAPDRAALQLLIRDLTRPNGICFSPDERFLYVDSTEPRKLWMRYPVHPDGSLGPGTVFFDATSDTSAGGPDGIKVDREGNVYSSGPGGIWIFSPAGKHLGTIPLPKPAGNLAFGDPDGRTLYITESDRLLRIRVLIPGILP